MLAFAILIGLLAILLGWLAFQVAAGLLALIFKIFLALLLVIFLVILLAALFRWKPLRR